MNILTEESKTSVGSWIIGLMTGVGIAAPLTAFIVKKIYDKKTNDAYDKGLETGLNSMAEYAISQESKLTEEDYEVRENSYDGVPTEEEINNYDLSIDDEEASERSKPVEEDIERYRDLVERYNGTLADTVYMIDAEKFMMDQTFEKSYVNWYEQDNKFEEDLLLIKDPYTTFGTADGNELFREGDHRPDPDIVYVRNTKQNTDYEVTRVHGSWATIVKGDSQVDQTDQDE